MYIPDHSRNIWIYSDLTKLILGISRYVLIWFILEISGINFLLGILCLLIYRVNFLLGRLHLFCITCIHFSIFCYILYVNKDITRRFYVTTEKQPFSGWRKWQLIILCFSWKYFRDIHSHIFITLSPSLEISNILRLSYFTNLGKNKNVDILLSLVTGEITHNIVSWNFIQKCKKTSGDSYEWMMSQLK